jgi:hypothetical protein
VFDHNRRGLLDAPLPRRVTAKVYDRTGYFGETRR